MWLEFPAKRQGTFPDTGPCQASGGLYQGVPLTRRGSSSGAVLPDKITIFRGPLVRLYGHHPETLCREVRRVVLHEVAAAATASTGS
jgi:predicted Zn-dependent protease with MMP-like domain